MSKLKVSFTIMHEKQFVRGWLKFLVSLIFIWLFIEVIGYSVPAFSSGIVEAMNQLGHVTVPMIIVCLLGIFLVIYTLVYIISYLDIGIKDLLSSVGVSLSCRGSMAQFVPLIKMSNYGTDFEVVKRITRKGE